MAARRNDADPLITEAAMKEFLKYGYSGASLRRIASAAGITTGALYTRFKGKDELFCSLTECVVQETERAFQELKPLYYAAANLEGMLKAMQAESETTLRILFDHYDEAVLLLCRSQGSSAGHFFDDLVKKKIEESEKFFRNFPKSEDLRRAFDVLLTAQFDMYRQILKNGYTREQAERCMEVLTGFMNGGWMSIMGRLMEEKA